MKVPPPKISVVVPVGRVDTDFEAALRGLLGQTYSNLEIVLVLDGLADAEVDALNARFRHDPRVRVLPQEIRRGAGHARNVGLIAATGTYVAFADADDLIPSHAYEHMLGILRDSDAQIVSGRAEQFVENGPSTVYWTLDSELWATRGRHLTLRDAAELAFDHTPWNKVFDAAWLRRTGVVFPVGTTCEDVSWWSQVVVRAVIDVTPEVVYRHRRHDRSVTAGIARGEDFRDWTVQTRAAVETYRAAEAEEALALLGKRMVRREAWSRVRRVANLSESDKRLLVDQVRWLADWVPSEVFSELSAYPCTAYCLLHAGEADLAARFVDAFDGPGSRVVQEWELLLPLLERDGNDRSISSALWRERLFRPAVDAAQRGEELPVPPSVVVDFFDAFDVDGLDQHEQTVVAALRTGDVDDVAFLRAHRRLRVSAARTRGALLVEFVGLSRDCRGRVWTEHRGRPELIFDGTIKPGRNSLPSTRGSIDQVVVEFLLARDRTMCFRTPVARRRGLHTLVSVVRRCSRSA